MCDHCMWRYRTPSSGQAELVKFEDAVLLIQDRYCSLQGATPPQLPASVRVALIEVGSGPSPPHHPLMCVSLCSAGIY